MDTLNSVDNLRGLYTELHDNTSTLDNHIPFVEENIQNPIMGEDFPRSITLSIKNSSNLKIKTRKDIPNQSFIDKLLGLLNHKSQHFYYLPFKLTTLHKEQRKDNLFTPLIDYLESNHLPSKAKCQHMIIQEFKRKHFFL